MDKGVISLDERLKQLTLAPTTSSTMRRPAGRRNSESSGGFRSGGSTATSSTSGASLASNGSTQSDSSHGSWGPKATFLPMEALANVGKISCALDSLPGSSGVLKKVVRDIALTYDAEISESVAQFNDTSRASLDWERCSVQPVRPLAGEIPVVEALQQLWRIKGDYSAQRRGQPTTSQSSSVVYEITKPHLRNEGYIAYATLPGGSCFGSLQQYATQGEARRSAARVALMNSVLNELPSRRITDEYIKRVVGAACREVAAGRIEISGKDSGYASLLSTPSRTTPYSVDDASSTYRSEAAADDLPAWNAVDVFHRLLLLNRGTTLLELKERITVYQLFQWNGDIQQAKNDGLSRDEVLQISLNKRLDDKFRNSMALKWAQLEREHRGRISRELQTVKRELDRLRASGREVRFAKEKKEILLEAFAIYQRQQQQRAAVEGGIFSQLCAAGRFGSEARSRCRRPAYCDFDGYSQASMRRTIASRY